jgi:hypothetical protein
MHTSHFILRIALQSLHGRDFLVRARDLPIWKATMSDTDCRLVGSLLLTKIHKQPRSGRD